MAEHRLAVQLARILDEVACRGDRHFTGTSVVICRALDGLPYCAMTEGWPVSAGASLVDNLLAMAHGESPYHDGFHLLTSNFEFLKVACYLAPRISDEAPRVSFAGRGSRFSTAYFMSLLSPAICVGIVGHRREVTVFRQGRILAGQGGPLSASTGVAPLSLSLVARSQAEPSAALRKG
ncbi:diadenylate cyclase [Denitromonas sp.]|uniref:diadenylate cyclase n=1 Tax=Denitromonas sp. TaxID=2734609 RepID=UPI002FDC8437